MVRSRASRTKAGRTTQLKTRKTMGGMSKSWEVNLSCLGEHVQHDLLPGVLSMTLWLPAALCGWQP
eukprot:5199747-Pyramimonas_sp.AAC.1